MWALCTVRPRSVAKPGGDRHEVYRAGSDIGDGAGHAMVTAYALARPDGQWSVMLVNRDQETAHKVKIVFDSPNAQSAPFAGIVNMVTFGRDQYMWHPSKTHFMAHAARAGDPPVNADGPGHADPDGPALRRQIDANKFLNSSVADFCAGTPMAKVLRKTRSRARILRRRLTNAETILWSRLRGSVCGTRFRRQHPIGPYIADFACINASIVIEIDGETHSTKAACEHDKRRDAYLRSRGWQIVRVWNRDVYESLDSVLESILGAVRGASRADRFAK